MTTTPAHAPRTTLITARFAGRCACGAKVAAGATIAFGGSYNHRIAGCAGCDFGTFEGCSADYLRDTCRSYMALADNAISMRARDGSVARLLTRLDLAAHALERARQREAA